MYFRITCTKCGKGLKVRDEDVGKRGKCPFCREPFTVPARIADAPIARPRSAAADTASSANAPSRPATSPPPHASTPAATPDRPPARAESTGSDAGGQEWTDGTNVSLLLSGAIGLGLAAIFLLAMWPLHSTGFGALFLHRGWVPYVEVFFMAWSIAILFLKWRKLKRQRESMLFDLLPTELADDINARTIDLFTRHVGEMPVKPGESFLIQRVLRGLEHFRVRHSTPEVGEMLRSQSDIDANAVESSYSIIKVFIWAIPILGFIGTVIGISDAVSGLGGNLDAADMEQIKAQLSTVTVGLGVAFDTTLVALVMSLLVMFPTSAMQKAEEDLLNTVEEYCNENLLKRLNDTGAPGGEHESVPGRAAFDMNDTVNKAIDAALVGRQGAMLHQIDQIQKQMIQMQRDHVDKLDASMRDLSYRTENVHQDVAATVLQTSEQLRAAFGDIHSSLEQLNTVLHRLGGEQIQIQLQPPPKRGWWVFGRRNGG